MKPYSLTMLPLSATRAIINNPRRILINIITSSFRERCVVANGQRTTRASSSRARARNSIHARSRSPIRRGRTLASSYAWIRRDELMRCVALRVIKKTLRCVRKRVAYDRMQNTYTHRTQDIYTIQSSKERNEVNNGYVTLFIIIDNLLIAHVKSVYYIFVIYYILYNIYVYIYIHTYIYIYIYIYIYFFYLYSIQKYLLYVCVYIMYIHVSASIFSLNN